MSTQEIARIQIYDDKYLIVVIEPAGTRMISLREEVLRGGQWCTPGKPIRVPFAQVFLLRDRLDAFCNWLISKGVNP